MKKSLIILLVILFVGGFFIFKNNIFLKNKLSNLMASEAIYYPKDSNESSTLSVPGGDVSTSGFSQLDSASSSDSSTALVVIKNNPINYCGNNIASLSSEDQKYCFRPPKENAFRLFEINLTDNKILFYENGVVQKIFPIAYQAPYGIWFETPTGYFDIGVKTRKLKSSVVPVYMEDAVQFYEDFFIHNIPYWGDGSKVTSQFSGGCIRLNDDIAKTFYDSAKTGDAVVSYVTLDNAKLKDNFFAPVNLSQFWVRQRYNSPIRSGGVWSQDKKDEYIQHAGLDLAPYKDATDLGVYAIYPGTVKNIVLNGAGDAGLGNTIILEHEINGEKIYSLYGHLKSIELGLRIGDAVSGGQKIATVGNTGYGCDYWKIGKDGCDQTGESDTHLHLEIKSEPVIGSPKSDICINPDGKKTNCVGYASDNPWLFGYQDPMNFLFSSF